MRELDGKSHLLKPIPKLDEFNDFVPAGPPGATGIEILPGGKLKVVKRPKRDNHLCVGCRHFFEYVRLKEPGPRPTGAFNAEWVSYCVAHPGEMLDVNEETILLCSSYQRVGVVERIRRMVRGKRP